MSPRRWRRVGAFGGSVLAAALSVVVVRGATARYERDAAERSAATIGAYLAIAAPPDRGGSTYNLAQLLIQARAVVTLIGSSHLEVYYATAPLVQAVAPPLQPAELERLRREETTGWDGDAALVPFLDREGWVDRLSLRGAMTDFFDGRRTGYRFPRAISIFSNLAWRLLLLNLWSRKYLAA